MIPFAQYTVDPSTFGSAGTLAGSTLFILIVFWSVILFFLPFFVWDIAKYTRRTSVNTKRLLDATIHLQNLIIAQNRASMSAPKAQVTPAASSPKNPTPRASS
jgi:hypothetical protein